LLLSKILLIAFIFVGLIGMTAETFYSYYWTTFYKKPLWEYSFGAIINRYTSMINFLVWSTGLVMFLLILSLLEWNSILDEYMEFSYIFLSLTIILHVVFVVGRLFIQKIGGIKKWDDGSLVKYLVVTIPISVSMFVASSLIDWRFLYYLLAFGISTFIAEYLYGKDLRILFGEKLWFYNYATIDDRHTSPYNIGGAIVLGVLFTYGFLLIVQL